MHPQSRCEVKLAHIDISFSKSSTSISTSISILAPYGPRDSSTIQSLPQNIWAPAGRTYQLLRLRREIRRLYLRMTSLVEQTASPGLTRGSKASPVVALVCPVLASRFPTVCGVATGIVCVGRTLPPYSLSDSLTRGCWRTNRLPAVLMPSVLALPVVKADMRRRRRLTVAPTHPRSTTAMMMAGVIVNWMSEDDAEKWDVPNTMPTMVSPCTIV